MATVSILTSPSGATVALDGVFVGKSPLNNIDVAPGRHSVALSYSGFEPKVVRIRAVTGELAKISETLSKIVVKTNTSEPTAPTAVVATRLPATPRVATSKEGNADTGKSLLGSGCNACHSENGTSSIGPRRFTSAQWDRFFARGSHDRYQRIGGAMSSSQMAHVKTYLKSKAADAVRNQGAGIR
jgi:cytochrome c5